ncbi:amidohydrolase family protein [Streptomyces sp. NPDC055506]
MVRLGIDMQLLSDVTVAAPADVRASNEYGASVVRRYPHRFGLLAALPLSDVDAALAEIEYAHVHLDADGFALCATYDGEFLGAEWFRPVWRALDAIGAGVFIHPSPFRAAALDLPRPFFEVTFDTARTVVDMVWRGVTRSAPRVRVVLAHAGGALPALAGRIALLSDADWVPHEGVTPETVREALAALYYDTAMAGTPNGLEQYRRGATGSPPRRPSRVRGPPSRRYPRRPAPRVHPCRRPARRGPWSRPGLSSCAVLVGRPPAQGLARGGRGGHGSSEVVDEAGVDVAGSRACAGSDLFSESSDTVCGHEKVSRGRPARPPRGVRGRGHPG